MAAEEAQQIEAAEAGAVALQSEALALGCDGPQGWLALEWAEKAWAALE